MSLSKAALKDLLRQIPEFDESELPTPDDKKAFIAAQLKGTQGAIYRSLVEVETAKEFALEKAEAYQDKARERLEEAAATLKAFKPSLKVLQRVAVELEKEYPTVPPTALPE